MFGEAWRITSEFPYYFLDYREVMDDQERWNDRFTSDDGTWSGNLYDFWGKVVNRLRSAVAHPFQLDADLHRIDDNLMIRPFVRLSPTRSFMPITSFAGAR